MHFETTVEIGASTERVWSILTDVERWPRMTRSIKRVERLDDTFEVGSRTRVQQPRLRPAVYTVTELDPGRAFVWESRLVGVVTTAGHYLIPEEDKVSVRFTIDQEGPGAWLIALLYGRLTRYYIALEAKGLKRVAES